MNVSKQAPKVELTIPIIPDMELAATKTAEVVAKHMGQKKTRPPKLAWPS